MIERPLKKFDKVRHSLYTRWMKNKRSLHPKEAAVADIFLSSSRPIAIDESFPYEGPQGAPVFRRERNAAPPFSTSCKNLTYLLRLFYG